MSNPSPASVGNKFVLSYYTYMNQNSQSLRHFYKDNSLLTHGSESSFGSVEETVSGVEEINKKIQKLDFRDCKVTLSVVDCQASQSGGIIVVVVGYLSNNGENPRKFVQTFFLAEQSKGYFVLNDIFRYIEEHKSQEGQVPVSDNSRAEELSRPLTQEQQPHSEPESKQKETKPAPIHVQELTQSPPVSKEVIQSIETVPSKTAAPPTTTITAQPANVPKKESPKSSAAVKKVVVPPPEEKPVPSGPKTWANIANTTSSIPTKEAVPAQSPTQSIKRTTPPPQQQTPTQKPPRTPKEERVVATGALFVSNVPFGATEDQVKATFAKFGEIKNVSINNQKGFVFLDVATVELAQKVIQNAKEGELIIDGRTLSVEERREKPKREGSFKERRGDRNERGERSERNDRPPRSERADRPERRDSNGKLSGRDQSARRQ